LHRELAIALRARVTWIVAALSALLVGHGFMLAADLFSASSRSALASKLQTREMDSLAGIVRPTLGGLDLAVVLLGPLIAARSLSIEKERKTYGALCLAEGSSSRVIGLKSAAASVAISLILVTPIVLLLAYRVAGGHVDIPETGVALLGAVLRMLLVVGASMAAAAWTRTLAQALTVGIAVSLTSWAIDAAEGFAALAWLGGASAWSIERRLLLFGRGLIPVGSLLWLLVATATGFGLACIGGSFTRSPGLKVMGGAAALCAGAFFLLATGGVRRTYDWTEGRRASLPPAVVESLRGLPGPIQIDVYLDRDDSRRRQIESDALQKLVLARSDTVIRMPLDEEERPTEATRGDAYGRIVVRAGEGARETRSTSRRELVTLVFEAAGRPLPDWTQPAYPGYPAVIEGTPRTCLALLAYVGVPLSLLVIGWQLSQRRIAR
jgi:ABC-type transport system involved in multi-copper enzyme maturation permease subunit